MKKAAVWVFICMFTSGCISDKVDISAKLTGASKSGDTVTLLKDNNYTVIDIQSKSGIGRLELAPIAGKWSATVVVRLHLRGLESLCISNDEFSVTTSVSTTVPHNQLCERHSYAGNNRYSIKEDSHYWVSLRVVNKKKMEKLSVPLDEGYFEAIIPPVLFDNKSDKIVIQWIDFFRG